MTASGPGPHIPVSIPEPQAPPRRRRGLRRRVARWWGERSPRTRVVAGLASFAVVAGGASYPGTTLLIPARNSGPLEYDASAGICMAQVPVGRVITLGEGWVRNRSGQDIDILDVDVHEAEGMEVIGAYLLPVLGDTAFGSAPTFPPQDPLPAWEQAMTLPAVLPAGEELWQIVLAVRITEDGGHAEGISVHYRSGWYERRVTNGMQYSTAAQGMCASPEDSFGD